MKCKICEQYYISETKFTNLFVFKDICDHCNSIYDIPPKYEIFPMQDGIIEYYYMYADLIVNVKQINYLEKYYENILSLCLNNVGNALLIFIDKYTYEELKNDLMYLEPFGRIIFVSLIRFNFEEFVFFS